jgi:hypothetical protein
MHVKLSSLKLKNNIVKQPVRPVWRAAINLNIIFVAE